MGSRADSLIFQTEKLLEENADKIPADKKAPVDEALATLKTAYEAKDMDAIEKAMEDKNELLVTEAKEL